MSSSDKLDAQDRVVLIQVKIEGAKKHLRNLSSEILSLDHAQIIDADADTKIREFKEVSRLPFLIVSLAGDIIHNLRSALDHLAYHLVAVGLECAPVVPLTKVEIRQIEFPIAETFEKYESNKARKVKRMLPEAVNAIDRLKPYSGGNEALWRIHELDNIDKHRTLFTFGKEFLYTGSWFPGAYLVKSNDPIFTGIETDVEKDFETAIKEAVTQPQVTNANALLPSLHELINFVDNLVLSFKPLLRNVYERNGK